MDKTTARNRRWMMSRLFRQYPDVVTVEQLCKMLHIGKNTAYALLRSGAMRSVRIGGKYIVPTKWIAEYLDKNKN